ncbi:hypothetical protein FSP39_015953 [Pinctada imbricata]|uniref:Uncharacterized protein n=1 Tax=Pinctada imbricata TaxID=66713 RepID=A0AA88YND5_PINIB|nr:hypothetical protein FSP39_015953 [Pinctada imbricata]
MSDSAHPCHNLSNPAAQIFMCRHCMAKFYDPIQRWRHSKICKKALAKSNPEIQTPNPVKKAPSQLPSRKPEDVIEEEPPVQVQTPPKKRKGNGESSSNLSCVICKKIFINMEEMREHVRNPCNKPERVLPSRGDATIETNPQLMLFENQLRQLEDAAKGGEENTCSQIESLLMAAQALQQHQYQQEKIGPQQQSPNESPPVEDVDGTILSQKSSSEPSGQFPVTNHIPGSIARNSIITDTTLLDNSQQVMDTELPSDTSKDGCTNSQDPGGNPSVIQVNATTIRLRLPEANKETPGKEASSGNELTVPGSTEENLSQEPQDLESSFTCELLQKGNCAATGIKIKKKKASPVPVSKVKTSAKKDISQKNKDFTKLSNKAIHRKVSKVTVDLSKNNQCHLKGCRHNGTITNLSTESDGKKKAKPQEVKVVDSEPLLDKSNENVNEEEKGKTEVIEINTFTVTENTNNSSEKKEEANKSNVKTITRREPSTRIRKRKVPFQELENSFSSYKKMIRDEKKPATTVSAKKSNSDTNPEEKKDKKLPVKDSKKPVRDSKKSGSDTAKPNKESPKTSKSNKKATNETKVKKEDKKNNSKVKAVRTPKCRICDKVFKTLDLLKKHNKVPCKVRLTRNLTQKVLRPKRSENNQKETAKPVVKKTAKPVSEPKMKMFDRKFTDARIENNTVKKSRKPVRRQKPEYNFCITRSQSLKRVQWAIDLEGLTEKEQYFYGLGLVSIEQIPIKCASSVIKQTQSVSVVENKQKEVNELPPVLEKVVEVRRHIQDDIYILNDPIRKSSDPPPLISVDSESSATKNRPDLIICDNSNKENLCFLPSVESAKSPLKTLEDRHFLDAIEMNSDNKEQAIESVQTEVTNTCVKDKDKEEVSEGNKSPAITVGLQTDITTEKIMYPRPDFYRRFLKKMEKQRLKDEEEAREKQIQGNSDFAKKQDSHDVVKAPSNIFDKLDKPNLSDNAPARSESKVPEVTIVYPDKPILSNEKNEKGYVPKLPYDPKLYEYVDDTPPVIRVPAEENVKVKDQHGKELVDLLAQTVGIFPPSKDDKSAIASAENIVGDVENVHKTQSSQEEKLKIIVLNKPSTMPTTTIECPVGKDVVNVPDIVEKQTKAKDENSRNCTSDTSGERSVPDTVIEPQSVSDNMKLNCTSRVSTASAKVTKQMDSSISRSLLPNEIVDVHLNLQTEQVLDRSKDSTSFNVSDSKNNTQEQLINENKKNLCTPNSKLSHSIQSQLSVSTSVTKIPSSNEKGNTYSQSPQIQTSQNSKSSSNSGSIRQCHKPLKKRIDSYMLSLKQSEERAKEEKSKTNAQNAHITKQVNEQIVASTSQEMDKQKPKVDEKEIKSQHASFKENKEDEKLKPVDVSFSTPALSPLPQEHFEPICNTILTFDSDLLSSDILDINPFLDENNSGNSTLDTSVIVSPKPSDSSVIVSPKPLDSSSTQSLQNSNVGSQSSHAPEAKFGLSNDTLLYKDTFVTHATVSNPKSSIYSGCSAKSGLAQKTDTSQSTWHFQATTPQQRPSLPYATNISQTTGLVQKVGTAQIVSSPQRIGLPYTANLTHGICPPQPTNPPPQRMGLPYSGNISQTIGPVQTRNSSQRAHPPRTGPLCATNIHQTGTPNQTISSSQSTSHILESSNTVYSDISDDSDEEETTRRQNTTWKALPINSLPPVDLDVLRQADRLSKSQLSSSQLQNASLLPNRTVSLASNRSACPSSAMNSSFESSKLDWTENDEMYVMSLLRYSDHMTHQPLPFQMYNVHSHIGDSNLNFQSNSQNIMQNPAVTISYTNTQSTTSGHTSNNKPYTENRLPGCNTTIRFSSIGNAPEVPRSTGQSREVWNANTSFESVYSDISDDSNDGSNVPTTINSIFWQKPPVNNSVSILSRQNSSNVVSSAFSDISDDSSDGTVTRRNSAKKTNIPQSKLCLESSSTQSSRSNSSSITTKPNCPIASEIVTSSHQTPSNISVPHHNSFPDGNVFSRPFTVNDTLASVFSATNNVQKSSLSSNSIVQKTEIANEETRGDSEAVVERTNVNQVTCAFSDDSSEGFDKSFAEHSIYESDDNEKVELSLTSITEGKSQPANTLDKSLTPDSPMIEAFDQSSNDIKFAETLFDQVIKKDKIKQGNKDANSGKGSKHSDVSGVDRTLKASKFTNDRAFASIGQNPVSNVLSCGISDSSDVAYVVIDKGVEICRTVADTDDRDDSDTGDDYTQGSDLEWS